MGILLTALESCQYPFETPEALHIPIMITCRVSSFGDDMLDRSVSQISFYPDENIYATDGPRLLAQENPKRKPVPQARTMPGDFPQERPITPLQEVPLDMQALPIEAQSRKSPCRKEQVGHGPSLQAVASVISPGGLHSQQ
jgi:hypothetical protein